MVELRQEGIPHDELVANSTPVKLAKYPDAFCVRVPAMIGQPIF